MGATDGFCANFRQADMLDPAGLHHVGHCADRLLDRHIRIEPRRAIDIDCLDAEPLQRICADADVMRFLRGAVGPEDAWRHMAFMLGHWKLRGYGIYAVEERATGRFLGRVGFLEPAGWPGFESKARQGLTQCVAYHIGGRPGQ